MTSTDRRRHAPATLARVRAAGTRRRRPKTPPTRETTTTAATTRPSTAISACRRPLFSLSSCLHLAEFKYMYEFGLYMYELAYIS
jgi:hypothetical protein